MKTCAACSARVHDEAMVCPECGEELIEDKRLMASQDLTVTAVFTASDRSCPVCGESLLAEGRREGSCSRCGSHLFWDAACGGWMPDLVAVPQGAPRRLLAFAIDVVIFYAAWFLVAIVAVSTRKYDPYVDPTDDRLLGYVVGFLYFFVCEGFWGATIGKLVCGLRVVQDTNRGTRSLLGSFVRNLLRPIDVVAGLPAILMSKSRQRLGDMAGRTVVVRNMKVVELPPQFQPVFGDEKPCPHCAKTIKKAATVCNHCGRDMPDPSIDAL
jgi:uncharacterized RDD family membrane protein YckC/ribosomal protein S27AE